MNTEEPKILKISELEEKVPSCCDDIIGQNEEGQYIFCVNALLNKPQRTFLKEKYGAREESFGSDKTRFTFPRNVKIEYDLK